MPRGPASSPTQRRLFTKGLSLCKNDYGTGEFEGDKRISICLLEKRSACGKFNKQCLEWSSGMSTTTATNDTRTKSSHLIKYRKGLAYVTSVYFVSDPLLAHSHSIVARRAAMNEYHFGSMLLERIDWSESFSVHCASFIQHWWTKVFHQFHRSPWLQTRAKLLFNSSDYFDYHGDEINGTQERRKTRN